MRPIGNSAPIAKDSQSSHEVLIVTSLFFPSITIKRPFLTSPLSPRIGKPGRVRHVGRINRDTFFHHDDHL